MKAPWFLLVGTIKALNMDAWMFNNTLFYGGPFNIQGM